MLTLSQIPKISFAQGSCVTLGFFDGVHRGHCAILGALLNAAKERNKPAIVLTFDVHPSCIIRGADAVQLITETQTRLALLRSYLQHHASVEYYIVCVPFSRYIATMSSIAFIQRMLMPVCHIEYMVLGEGAVFGADRCASIVEAPFPVHYIPLLLHSGLPITSSRVRKALSEGKIEEVNTLLWKEYTFSGYVVHGEKRGSTLLGFPTANVTIPETIIPKKGVYAVRVQYNGSMYKGIMNIGMNPTFQRQDTGTQQEDVSIEVHILDFDRNIYGEYLNITVLQRIRDEKKFTSPEFLIEQIRADRAYVLEHW